MQLRSADWEMIWHVRGLCAGQTGVADQQRQAALGLEQRGENVEAEAAWHGTQVHHQVLRRTPTLASWKRARALRDAVPL